MEVTMILFMMSTPLFGDVESSQKLPIEIEETPFFLFIVLYCFFLSCLVLA